MDGTAVNPLDPIALDESSDFFKNAAAVRLLQPTPAAQAAQTPKVDQIKPASEQPQASMARGIASPHTDSAQPATNPGNKAVVAGPASLVNASPGGAGNASRANDDVSSQQRPRRVTHQWPGCVCSRKCRAEVAHGHNFATDPIRNKADLVITNCGRGSAKV